MIVCDRLHSAADVQAGDFHMEGVGAVIAFMLSARGCAKHDSLGYIPILMFGWLNQIILARMRWYRFYEYSLICCTNPFTKIGWATQFQDGLVHSACVRRAPRAENSEPPLLSTPLPNGLSSPGGCPLAFLFHCAQNSASTSPLDAEWQIWDSDDGGANMKVQITLYESLIVEM